MKDYILKYIEKGKNLSSIFKTVNALEQGKPSSVDKNLLEGTVQ